MNLYIDSHTFHYEMENLLRAFFVYDKINVIKEYDGTIDVELPSLYAFG